MYRLTALPGSPLAQELSRREVPAVATLLAPSVGKRRPARFRRKAEFRARRRRASGPHSAASGGAGGLPYTTNRKLAAAEGTRSRAEGAIHFWVRCGALPFRRVPGGSCCGPAVRRGEAATAGRCRRARRETGNATREVSFLPGRFSSHRHTRTGTSSYISPGLRGARC